MSSQGLNSLATIIKRLEAATSRLEDIAVAQSGGSISFPDSAPARPASTVLAARPTSPGTSAQPAKQGGAPVDTAPDSVPPFVAAYDERIINGKLKTFIDATRALGEAKLTEQASLVANMFRTTRGILLCASACKKPSDTEFMELMKPVFADYNAIAKIKDDNARNREWTLHFQTIAEGASSGAWVQQPNKTSDYVTGSKESAEFYGNRVIKDYKDRDKKHVDWVRSYIGLLDELGKYVTEYHKLGLVWNAKGGKATEFSSKSTAEDTSAIPVPPPPPPTLAPASGSSSTGGLTGTAAVFAQINQGTDVTKHLKKVDKSEMTHKNPSLRASGTVPATATSPSPTSKGPLPPKKPASLKMKKPPKMELQGSKWVVEYQENESGLILSDVSINQVVTLYGCKNTVLQIKGKINGISMTNCQKTSIVVESAVSVISITNCQSFQLQVLGSAPTIQIETTDSGQVYLSSDCLEVEIITAKCSAINISIPSGEDGDFAEKPVPEMLRSVIQNGKLVTSIVEHTG
ncbi:hypothetical protein CPB86DRAFT_854521 [Serendipita vermifera]|nr:hypothetical protein CPB86DRAFT_854521 [Serendipita vermifera]